MNDYDTQNTINDLVDQCHAAASNAGWWNDIDKGDKRHWASLLTLVHSEVSEAMEGLRRDLNDDHLPHRKMEEVELADAIIRIFDYAGGKGLDLGGAIIEKIEYNARRADHKVEARQQVNGKAF